MGPCPKPRGRNKRGPWRCRFSKRNSTISLCWRSADRMVKALLLGLETRPSPASAADGSPCCPGGVRPGALAWKSTIGKHRAVVPPSSTPLVSRGSCSCCVTLPANPDPSQARRTCGYGALSKRRCGFAVSPAPGACTLRRLLSDGRKPVADVRLLPARRPGEQFPLSPQHTVTDSRAPRGR